MISGQECAPSLCRAPPASVARSMLVAQSCRSGQGAPLRGFPSAYNFRLAVAPFRGGLLGRQELLHWARRLFSELGGCNVCMLRRFSIFATGLRDWLGSIELLYRGGDSSCKCQAMTFHPLQFGAE